MIIHNNMWAHIDCMTHCAWHIVHMVNLCNACMKLCWGCVLVALGGVGLLLTDGVIVVRSCLQHHALVAGSIPFLLPSEVLFATSFPCWWHHSQVAAITPGCWHPPCWHHSPLLTSQLCIHQFKWLHQVYNVVWWFWSGYQFITPSTLSPFTPPPLSISA